MCTNFGYHYLQSSLVLYKACANMPVTAASAKKILSYSSLHADIINVTWHDLHLQIDMIKICKRLFRHACARTD